MLIVRYLRKNYYSDFIIKLTLCVCVIMLATVSYPKNYLRNESVLIFNINTIAYNQMLFLKMQ